MVYLDYNATTPLAPEAMEAMLPYLREHYGNPSSIHGAGRSTRAAIDDARDRMARLLGARAHELIFTCGRNGIGQSRDPRPGAGERGARAPSDHGGDGAPCGAARVPAPCKATKGFA